jgi:hypothetical protein
MSEVKTRRDAEGIRLVQDTFNATSMALYASLGFEAKEPRGCYFPSVSY